MECLDCILSEGRPTPAVGICVDCGAGICSHHAVIVEHHLTRPAAIMREIPVEPAARLLRCGGCHAAHQAVARGGETPQRSSTRLARSSHRARL